MRPGTPERSRWGRRRALILLGALLAPILVVAALAAFGLVVVSLGPGSSSAPTLPACSGGLIAEGFSYRFRDPHRGELVNVHVRGEIGGPITPDPDGDEFIAKRVIGVPGDNVAWRDGRVIVNGERADDIPTAEFATTRLDRDEYYVMGDNRSHSQDSRDFGPVPRRAIFSRVLLVWWPIGRFGPVGYGKTLTPPGPVACD